MSRKTKYREVHPAQIRAEARTQVKLMQMDALHGLVYEAGLAQGAIAAYVGCDASRISRVLNPAEPDILSAESQWQLAQLAARFGCDAIANGHTVDNRCVQPVDGRTNGSADDEVIEGTELLGRASSYFRETNFARAERKFSRLIAVGQRGLAECRLKIESLRGGPLNGRAHDGRSIPTAQ